MEKKQQMDLKDVLIQHGISPSFHRLKVYEFLMNNPIHPTVDMLYSSIITDIPTLSRTTIYNTLKTFIERGIVQGITIEDNEIRYDADLSIHGHFKCMTCGALIDIPEEQLNIDKRLMPGKHIAGHAIRESHFYFKGICKECS